LINEIWPGAKRACLGVIGGGGIGIVPFWNMDFSGTSGGGWEKVGEGAVDE